MPDENITEYFDGNYFPLGILTYNASIFLGVNEYDGVSSYIGGNENESRTQHILANGTRTKVLKELFASRRPNVGAFIMKLSFYTCPVIVVVGLLSNILAYMVFTRTRLRKVPSVPYLAAMAVVDSGALVTEFIQFGINLHGIHIINWSWVCQYTTYFSFVFIFLCIWYPVALCVEKFISVYFPLRKSALCTTFRAKVVVIGLMVMAGTCYYYVIYMVGPVGSKYLLCAVWDVFRKDFSYLMNLDAIFVIVLPNCVLVVLLVLICGRGCEYYRISSAVEVPSRTGSTRHSSLRAPVRVTNVIFPVVFIVLFLRVPVGLMRIYWAVTGRSEATGLVELQSVLIYAGRFEWVVKLYVYLVFSPSFRRRTKALLCGLIAKLKNKCRRDSFDDEEVEGIAGAARIDLPERGDRESNGRACLMVSDV